MQPPPYPQQPHQQQFYQGQSPIRPPVAPGPQQPHPPMFVDPYVQTQGATGSSLATGPMQTRWPTTQGSGQPGGLGEGPAQVRSGGMSGGAKTAIIVGVVVALAGGGFGWLKLKPDGVPTPSSTTATSAVSVTTSLDTSSPPPSSTTIPIAAQITDMEMQAAMANYNVTAKQVAKGPTLDGWAAVDTGDLLKVDAFAVRATDEMRNRKAPLPPAESFEFIKASFSGRSAEGDFFAAYAYLLTPGQTKSAGSIFLTLWQRVDGEQDWKLAYAVADTPRATSSGQGVSGTPANAEPRLAEFVKKASAVINKHALSGDVLISPAAAASLWPTQPAATVSYRCATTPMDRIAFQRPGTTAADLLAVVDVSCTRVSTGKHLAVPVWNQFLTGSKGDYSRLECPAFVTLFVGIPEAGKPAISVAGVHYTGACKGVK